MRAVRGAARNQSSGDVAVAREGSTLLAETLLGVRMLRAGKRWDILRAISTMSAVTLTTVFRRRPDVRYRRIEGEAVVLRQSAAEVLVLNEVGASVLDLADGERSVRDWIEELGREYETDAETLARDVLEFAGELHEAGMLEEVAERRGP